MPSLSSARAIPVNNTAGMNSLKVTLASPAAPSLVSH